MKKYKTDADCEQLFNEFMELKRTSEIISDRIQNLAGIVQNQDIEITENNLGVFGADCWRIRRSLQHLEDDIYGVCWRVAGYLREREIK